MTPGRRRPAGPPPSAGVLARYAQAYAREVGVAEGRVRAWVAYMIMAGALERAAGAAGPRFIVKGGVALELRLRDRARATKDIDVVLRDGKADLSDALERAVTGHAYQGFSFRRKGEPLLLDNGAVNMEFAVTYQGQPWTSISVDIARAEAGESDVEWVEAIALTDAFGVTGPAQLPCLPLRFHVAQKLHGMTLPPRPGKQNERFRDLVDLLLMEALVAHDYPALRKACELVFGSRNTHGWPPNLDAVPSHWAAPFGQLARELDLPDTDVETALIRVRSFVGRILSAGSQFDMLVLAESQEFDGDTLRLAVAATFARRKTAIPGDCPMALTQDFSDGSHKKTRWNAFVRRARRPDFQEFSEVVDTLARFLQPVLQAATRDEHWPYTWLAGGP